VDRRDAEPLFAGAHVVDATGVASRPSAAAWIRTVEIRGGQLLVNGVPIYLKASTATSSTRSTATS